MPNVITFWQTKEDEDQFLSFLGTTGDVVVYPSGWQEVDVHQTKKPLSSYLDSYPRHLAMISLNDFSSEIVAITRQRGNNNECKLSPVPSYGIVYDPGTYESTFLLPANCYAYLEFAEKRGGRNVRRKKSKEFIAWVSKSFRYLRAHANERCPDLDLPMTTRARRASEAGVQLGSG